MNRRQFLTSTAGLALITASTNGWVSSAACAQEKLEQTTVDIVATRDTQNGAQLAIADALGYFKDEGLQVAPKWVQTADDVVQLIGSGAVPVGCASTFAATLLAAQKMPIHAIARPAHIAATTRLAR